MDSSSILSQSMGDISGYYVPLKHYDPNSSARILCIELPNNSQIFIKYSEKFTVADIIQKILTTKEYRYNAYQRDSILDSQNHINLYDLHLCLYSQIKPEYENKISNDIKIDSLHEKGFIKNAKYPFFIFKDNKLPYSFMSNSSHLKSDLLKNVIDSGYDGNAIYSLYLPRINTVYKINSFPELEDYFIKNKKSYNEFNHFNLNELLNEHDKFDWFIYDNESMNFLINMNKINIDVKSKLKLIDEKLYFEDICDDENVNLNFTEKDVEKIFLKIYYQMDNPSAEGGKDLIIQKIKITLTMTAKDVIEKMKKKVNSMNSEWVFEPDKMVLKVRSLNDYIFNINNPLINYSYIHECIKHNKEGEYIILKNPSQDPDIQNQLTENEINTQNVSQYVTYIHYPFDNLLSLAVYNPVQKNENNENNDNISSEIENPHEYLSKHPKILGEENPEDNLDLFINSLIKDLNEETKEEYEKSLNEIDVKKEIKNYNEKYEVKDIKEINEDLNNVSLSLNNTTLMQSSTITTSIPKRRRKKGEEIVEVPNMFLPENQNLEEKEKDELNQTFLSSINIRDIDRPFSILIKSAHIKELLNSTPFQKNINMIFEFKIQLFLGNQPFSKAYSLIWKNSTQDLNPEINKRIYFDFNYSQIPNFCSIIFKVKFLQYNDDNELMGNQTKYYANFRLFDHNLRLKSGIHKINLYNGLFKDDAYYYFLDNDEEDKCSKIYFEIENFNKTVYNRITHIKNYNYEGSFMISDSEAKKIEDIKKRSYFEEINSYDKKPLWGNRYKLSGEPELLSQLLSCVEYSDPIHLIELEKILEMAKELNSIQSVGLLGGKFLHESIRNFAVKCLRKSTNIEINEYLYELIHGLRYEINHDNELARFLIEKAVKYPVTIGHSFYWILKSQMYEQNFQQRYGLYLEIFLNKIGPNLAKIFFDEDLLMTKLEEICEYQKNKKLGKKDKLNNFKDSIHLFNKQLTDQLNEISLPIGFKYRVDQINFENCKIQILKDNKPELLVSFKNVDPLGDNILVNYYNDKDIRMNLVTMKLFNIFHSIWCENNFILKMPLYEVMTTSRNKGIIQLIPDTQTLDEMPIKETSGFKNLFGKRSLNKYLTLNSGISPEEVYDNFISTNVSYGVANLIIGVTQRNKKNLHFKKDGEIYYTSYEHLLNHYSKILGDRGVPFLFNITFVDFLTKLNKIKDFTDLFKKAFMLMRDKSKDIITLIEILVSSGLPEISNKSLHYMEDSLLLIKTQKEAENILDQILNSIMAKK